MKYEKKEEGITLVALIITIIILLILVAVTIGQIMDLKIIDVAVSRNNKLCRKTKRRANRIWQNSKPDE